MFKMDVRTSPQLVKLDDNTKIEINNTPFSVGRSLVNNHVISSKLVSRKHCVFTQNELGWSITDCSTNGTRLNDEVLRNTGANLKEGDIIILTSEPYIYKFMPNIIEVIDISDEQLCDIAQKVETQEMNKKHAIEPQSASTKKLKSTEQTEETNTENKDAKVTVEEEKNKPEGALNNSHMNVVEDELTCSICSELFIKAVTINCSHSFCKQCIEMWIKNKKICPICRAPISTINATLVLDNFITKTLEKASAEVKEHRKKMVEEREALEKKNKPESAAPWRHEAGNSDSDRVLRNAVAEVIDLDESSDDGMMDFDEDDTNTELSSEEAYDDYFNNDWYSPGTGRAQRGVGPNGRRTYYGGYGACYTCGLPGHWANSCPSRNTNNAA